MSGDGFRLLDERPVFAGHVIDVVVGTFRAPDGSTFERDIVRHPGWVAVVPLTEDREVVLVRHYRAPVDRALLELPAGIRDVADEPPERTAARELAEEVGLAAAELTLLAQVNTSPGFTDEAGWLFLATGLTTVEADAQGPEEQAMTVERIPLSEAAARIGAGEITDAKTQIGILLTLARP